MFNLSGKNILLTGVTGGIGEITAEILIKAGARVIGTGTRQQKLEELSLKFNSTNSSVNGINDKFIPIVCNLSNDEDISTLFSSIEKNFEKLDALICNAGITRDNLAMRMKMDEWNEVININLTSVFKLNQLAIKKMMTQRFGRIINITSIIGFTGNMGQANYSAAKAGIIGMSKSLAIECASRNITVNCIAPGFVVTPMTDVLRDDIKDHIMKRIPMGRFGVPKDIAAAVVFLASDESAYITGSVMHVNGGMYM